jgi:hypothetical protein
METGRLVIWSSGGLLVADLVQEATIGRARTAVKRMVQAT